MLRAMAAARKGTNSINKVADIHGVPRIMLKDSFSGGLIHETAPGPKKYTGDEETALADRFVEVANIGYGKTQRQVKFIAEKVAKEKDLLQSSQISDGGVAV